jgi:transcriptional regulator with XRE-family HTH domain
MSDEQALGVHVRNLREQRAMPLKQLSEAAGVSESFVSQVEREVTNPSVASPAIASPRRSGS